MPATQPPFFPQEQLLLDSLGERLRLARLRRQLSVETVAARAGISRMTLFRAEKGAPAVSLGTYMRILEVLRLQHDIALIAKDDLLGRRLQDLKLPARRSKARKTANANDTDISQTLKPAPPRFDLSELLAEVTDANLPDHSDTNWSKAQGSEAW